MTYFEEADIDLVRNIIPENTITSIQAKPDGFIFSVYSLQHEYYFAFGYYRYDDYTTLEDFHYQTIKSIFEDNEILQKFNNKIVFSYFGRKSVLVPKEYFNPGNLYAYMSLSFPLGEYDEIHYKTYPELEVSLTYTAPNNIVNLVNKYARKLEISHVLNGVVNYVSEMRDDGDEINDSLISVINIENQYFEIISFSGAKLLNFNSYNHCNEDEVVYHTQNSIQRILKEKGISISYLIVTGEPHYDGREIELLKKYNGKVFQLDPQQLINFSENLKEKINLHYYTTLFLQVL